MNLRRHKSPCRDRRPRLSIRAQLEDFLSPLLKFDVRETLVL
jgi:hypothetical protein